VPDYVIGAKAEEIVTPLYTMSPDVEAFFKTYIEQAGSAR
jgi:hypothetical protein